MPFVHLKVARQSLSHLQRRGLQTGLTRLMETILRKQFDLTVVAIEHSEPAFWSAGGEAIAPDDWVAQLDAFVTAGTNTSAERSRFIAAAHALLAAQLGPAGPLREGGVSEPAPRAPVYVIVHEVPADNWGYDGLTQEARRHGADRVPAASLAARADRGADAPSAARPA